MALNFRSSDTRYFYNSEPSTHHPWGTYELSEPANQVWFRQRHEAVTYAHERGWKHYAIARAWGFE